MLRERLDKEMGPWRNSFKTVRSYVIVVVREETQLFTGWHKGPGCVDTFERKTLKAKPWIVPIMSSEALMGNAYVFSESSVDPVWLSQLTSQAVTTLLMKLYQAWRMTPVLSACDGFKNFLPFKLIEILYHMILEFLIWDSWDLFHQVKTFK